MNGNAADADRRPLPVVYADWLATAIDEDGITLPWAISTGADGKSTVHALAMPVPQALLYILSFWAREAPAELIYAFDRFTKPDQGTTLGDVMAGVHFVDTKARPFIVEYQHEPRIVKAIDWDNAFWNAALVREAASVVDVLRTTEQGA